LTGVRLWTPILGDKKTKHVLASPNFGQCAPWSLTYYISDPFRFGEI